MHSVYICLMWIVCWGFASLTERAARDRFPPTVGSNAWDLLFSRRPSLIGRGRRPAVLFVVCFQFGGILFCFLFFLPFERTRSIASAVVGLLASFSSQLQ